MIDETAIGERYRALAGELDERRRRLWAAAAARATGMAENTIRRGLRELETGERLDPGGGRAARGGGPTGAARRPAPHYGPAQVVDTPHHRHPRFCTVIACQLPLVP